MPEVVVHGAALHLTRMYAAPLAARERPVLVFLHDSLGCDGVWRDVPDRLAAAAGCDALVYDRRGYGQSAIFASEPRRPASGWPATGCAPPICASGSRATTVKRPMP